MNLKKSTFSILLLSSVLAFLSSSFAQSPKKYFKTGEDFVEAENHQDAIIQFTKAIEIKSDYTDAYLERAKSYEKLEKLEDAAEDYNRLVALETKESEFPYNLGRLYFDLEKYQKSVEALSIAIELDKKYLSAIQMRSLALIKLGKYEEALADCNRAIEIEKKDGVNYYNHGVVSDSLEDYETAEADFTKAIQLGLENEATYIALAKVRIKRAKLDEAFEASNKVIELDQESEAGYFVKSKIYFLKKDFPNAINDISKVLAINPKNEEAYYQRGIYYQKLSQHQNAINDFTQGILLNNKNYKFFYKRAHSNESIANYDGAIKDYESLRRLSPYDEEAKRMLEDAKDRLYELNREDKPPFVDITSPNTKGDNVLEVSEALSSFSLEGQVKDASAIEYIKVSGSEINFNKDELNPSFTTELNTDAEKIIVETSDIYGNKLSIEYQIEKTETNPPEISLIAPYASDNGEVYLDSEDPSLYVEGKIKDKSLIKSIFIEGATASYVYESTNPTFSATIDVSNKNKILVKAEDIYGNVSEKTFTLNREAARIAGDNPMGKTWVVFIENSDYESFASLDGPVKDVTMMKSAFANYEIHNIIHKKNMAKVDLERFFSIELRDLIRSNRVNSILVWYAGHGKFINESGYWIPVNAKRDDEFTYFNINSLKAFMHSYSNYVTHALVVTDACESGPSFYQAMRSTETEKRCDDWSATKFKSSQVFSSAGYELATDNSQFTKTFANSLSNNPNACIPIDKVVSKVTQAVAKNNSQRPKFGKISGLEDENGTFFFIKK
ncbi:MAG: tetratricopeptide repeat protein [Vicingaceae bacterium]